MENSREQSYIVGSDEVECVCLDLERLILRPSVFGQNLRQVSAVSLVSECRFLIQSVLDLQG